MAKYFGGVQGGGTQSDAVILSASGEVVGQASGPGTNPWQVGFEQCVASISAMVAEAKRDAGLDPNQPLETLGMSLSGGEQPEAQKKIIEGLQTSHAHTSKHYHVCTDTFGSIATAFPNGGMVLISGTGSNCQLLNPGGDSPRCGGWGHMLGDEGSGYWIAHMAIKLVYDSEDGLAPAPYDITTVKTAIYEFFELKDRYDILDHLYGPAFRKSDVAAFCKPLAQLCRATRDPLCLHIFHQAGLALGGHIHALIPKTDKSLLTQPGGLHIVAEGSVLSQCWDMLKEGFLEALEDEKLEFTIVILRVSSAVGAAALGAKEGGASLSQDFSSYTTTLFHYKPA